MTHTSTLAHLMPSGFKGAAHASTHLKSPVGAESRRRPLHLPLCQAFSSWGLAGSDCTRTFGLLLRLAPLSLMGWAGWLPIASTHSRCCGRSGFFQPRSYLFAITAWSP